MRGDVHRKPPLDAAGVEDPVHAWKLPARKPGDPGDSPAEILRGTVREGLWPHVGHARFQGVGRFHSTREAGEQGRHVCGGGVRGGKGIDQGKGHTNLTRTGLRAGTSEASDRVEYEETQRLHVSDPR